jgi:hypothetical protein
MKDRSIDPRQFSRDWKNFGGPSIWILDLDGDAMWRDLDGTPKEYARRDLCDAMRSMEEAEQWMQIEAELDFEHEALEAVTSALRARMVSDELARLKRQYPFRTEGWYVEGAETNVDARIALAAEEVQRIYEEIESGRGGPMCEEHKMPCIACDCEPDPRTQEEIDECNELINAAERLPLMRAQAGEPLSYPTPRNWAEAAKLMGERCDVPCMFCDGPDVQAEPEVQRAMNELILGTKSVPAPTAQHTWAVNVVLHVKGETKSIASLNMQRALDSVQHATVYDYGAMTPWRNDNES